MQLYCKFKLKKTTPYKTVAAALLMLVYLFIATPVSWWHHHVAATDAGNVPSVEQKGDFVVPEAHSSDCPVCRHHYSPYTETAFQVVTFQAEISSVVPIPLYNGIYHHIVLHSPGNKGPPALA